MSHIDEATIHAWLDGALDAEQWRAVEAHVLQCAECEALAAEARGLTAAASRILRALDHVPANVIPAAAAAAANTAAPARPPRRMWRAAPWVTGIAAVLVAAVVLRTGEESARDPQVASAPAAPAAAVELRDAAPAPEVRRGERARAAGAGERAAAQMATPSAGAVAAAAAPVAREAKVSALADASVRTPAPYAGLAGCYVVFSGQRAGSYAQDVAAGAIRQGVERQRAAAAVAVAPIATGVPDRLVIRLDSLQGRSGFIVRAAASDSQLGWWTPVGPDSALVNLDAGAVFGLTPGMRTRCRE